MKQVKCKDCGKVLEVEDDFEGDVLCVWCFNKE